MLLLTRDFVLAVGRSLSKASLTLPLIYPQFQIMVIAPKLILKLVAAFISPNLGSSPLSRLEFTSTA
jgi:hypothetical protein